MKSKGQSKKDKPGMDKLKLVYFVSATIFIIFGFFFVMNDEYLLVKGVEVVGAEQVAEEDVIEIANSVLEEKFLFFIPRSNVLFVPNNKIEKKLQDRFLTLDRIDTKILKLETLQIKMIEKDPEYLYCKDSGETTGQNKLFELIDEDCWYVDSDGLVFMESPYFSDNVYIKFNLPDQDLEIGDYVGGEDFFKDFSEIFGQMNEIDIRIRKIVFGDMGDINMKLIKFGDRNLYNGSEIRINTNNLSGVISSLGILIKHPDFVKRFFENKESLDYIDLRFGNKIIYKFHEQR